MMPIIWDYQIILESFSFMLYFPMVNFLVNIREITMQNQLPDMQLLGISILASMALAIAGYHYMKNHSKKALEFL
jgi:ABC-type polysaccharide/polyol phosphate export permease